MPNGPHRITGFNFEPELFDSEYSVEDAEIKVRYLINIFLISFLHTRALPSLSKACLAWDGDTQGCA